MGNGWTGGQYSLLRFGFGLWLGWRFVRLGGAEGPLVSGTAWALAAIGLLSGIALALGWRDRSAALIAVACHLALAHRVGIVVAWPLLAHAWIRRIPYGSLAAVGRVDPGGGWALPGRIYATTWGVVGVLFLWPLLAGATLHPIVTSARLAWLPLGAFPRTRPWIWALALLSQGWSAAWLRAPDELALLVVLWFAFDPGWIRPALPGLRDLLFFDGGCGLCHRMVRFVLAEDGSTARFEFAPLNGDTFRDQVPVAEQDALPDSLVLRTPEGRLGTRSESVLRVMGRLGGIWRLLAAVGRLFPERLRDAAYDGLARRRHTVFARPERSCPVIPEHLLDRIRS